MHYTKKLLCAKLYVRLPTAHKQSTKEDVKMKNQDNDTYSLAHTTWKCQYHIVFTPKYHRKIIYGALRAEIGKILRELCERKEVEIIEAHAMPNHIHMLVSIPPNEKVSSFMGYLKGKSTMIIFERYAHMKYKLGNRHFWSRGYYVSTVTYLYGYYKFCLVYMLCVKFYSRLGIWLLFLLIILSKCAKTNQSISRGCKGMKNKEITVLDQALHINKDDYFSLTDIARYKNPEAPADVVKNWLRRKDTIEFIGLWERLNNPDFNVVEFDLIFYKSSASALVFF